MPELWPDAAQAQQRQALIGWRLQDRQQSGCQASGASECAVFKVRNPICSGLAGTRCRVGRRPAPALEKPVVRLAWRARAPAAEPKAHPSLIISTVSQWIGAPNLEWKIKVASTTVRPDDPSIRAGSPGAKSRSAAESRAGCRCGLSQPKWHVQLPGREGSRDGEASGAFRC